MSLWDSNGYGEEHSSEGTFVVRYENGKAVERWGSYGWGKRRVENARKRIGRGRPNAEDRRLHCAVPPPFANELVNPRRARRSVPVRQGAAVSTATALSRKQHEALYLLRLARKDDPNTDDGVMSSEATFYDKAVAVAFVHWRTARALHERGLVTYGAYDPDWGTELRLVDAGVSGVG